jgi:hypothetical protein
VDVFLAFLGAFFVGFSSCDDTADSVSGSSSGVLVVLGSGLRRRTVVSSAIGMSLAHEQRGQLFN